MRLAARHSPTRERSAARYTNAEQRNREAEAAASEAQINTQGTVHSSQRMHAQPLSAVCLFPDASLSCLGGAAGEAEAAAASAAPTPLLATSALMPASEMHNPQCNKRRDNCGSAETSGRRKSSRGAAAAEVEADKSFGPRQGHRLTRSQNIISTTVHTLQT